MSRLPVRVASHRWTLSLAREAFHIALTGRDRTLPALAERRIIRLPGAAGPLEARLYHPQGVAADAPLLLFFHGGGFVVSDLDTHEALCIRLADAGGLRVLSASYRLAPEHRFPAQLDDAVAAARWVLSAADKGVGGAGGFAIGGDSAGGYLAAATAARIETEQPGAIRAQLLLYPLLHLDEQVWAASLLRETRLIGWAAARYIRAQLSAGPAGAPSLLTPGAVAHAPTVIAVGGLLDPVRADALVLAAQLERAGVNVALREYPTLIHGFGNLTHASGAARRAVAEVGRLVGDLVAQGPAR